MANIEKKNKREWHPDFVAYTEFIVNHSNYKGLFFDRDKNNRVHWVVTGKSYKGRQRKIWWDDKCGLNAIPITAGCYAKIARLIHPTKMHVCQICGRKLSVEYVYPSASTLKQINSLFTVNFKAFSHDIFHIIDALAKSKTDIDTFRVIFGFNNSNINDLKSLKSEVKKLCDSESPKFSPGVMSNSPDRFDGFHSDGACCRHESDTGRQRKNMIRYGQDRRVYTNWADGNWKMADRLMSEFRRHGISADHIGPISLGFCHRPKFQPMTKSQNSAKNNRMSFEDVKTLIADEKNEQVVSWHSRYIWDSLKSRVMNDYDARKLSDLMRKNLNYILQIFASLKYEGLDKVLIHFLNIDFSFFDYRFVGFDPRTGKYKKCVQKSLAGKNQQNNVERYTRIAFDELQNYISKENRKNKIWNSTVVDAQLVELITVLKSNSDDPSRYKGFFAPILKSLAQIAEESWNES